MNKIKLSSFAFAALIIAACNTTKKSTTAVVPAAPVPVATTNTTDNNMMMLKPATGIYIPGEEELAAIKAQFSDVTVDQLKKGHSIYAFGACVRCHGAIPIYEIEDANWPHILEDMAYKAHISDAEKDIVNKYVLAVKAVKKQNGK